MRRTAEKRVGAERARERIAAWHTSGENVAVARGAFDLLGVDQLRALEAARASAVHLVVAVASDRAARAALGPGRPVLAAADRAALVAGMRAVDLVVIDDPPSAPFAAGALAPGAERTIGPGAAARDPAARVRARGDAAGE